MHFRQNRKMAQAVGRGHSRSWFIGLEVRLLVQRTKHFPGLFPRIGLAAIPSI